MTDFTCIGDRFVMIDHERAIDLATGETVAMRMSVAGTRAEQLRWASECGTWYEQWSADGNRLVDYGRCGEALRFEAWQDDARAADEPYNERPVDRALAELFEAISARPRVLCLFGPPGSGK